MKRKITNFKSYSIVMCIFVCTSCVKDDIYLGSDDLSISSHTPITRSVIESDQDYIQDESDVIRKNKQYNAYDNTCALVAIMEDWIAQKNSSYFGSNCPETAQQHYDKLVKNFKNMYPDWTIGNSITSGQFLSFSGNMYETPKYFDMGTEVESYFSNDSNHSNIAIVFLEKINSDGTKEEHYAYVKNIEKKYLVVAGEEICKRNRIYYNGESGWKIVAVVNKKKSNS